MNDTKPSNYTPGQPLRCTWCVAVDGETIVCDGIKEHPGLHHHTNEQKEMFWWDENGIRAKQKPVCNCRSVICHCGEPPAPIQPIEAHHYLNLPITPTLSASIPFPMSEDAFRLLTETLELWKERLVVPNPNEQI